MGRDRTDSLWQDRAAAIEVDQWPQQRAFDVAVVGGGLTGLTTAVLLARAGRRVIVIEARTIGAVTTGRTTGKISLLQGTQLSKIANAHDERVAAAYLEGSRAGQQWLLDYCAQQRVDVQHRDAVTYTVDHGGTRRDIIAEFNLGRRLGLDLTIDDGDELPFSVAAGTRLPAQAQLDPMELLGALTAELRRRGGTVVDDTRVQNVHTDGRATVVTSRGDLTAEAVVIASGVPFLDRGLYFAKVTPQRSYLVAFVVPNEIPQQMYLSADTPTRSLRTAQHRGDELLLVGGNGHVVGQHRKPPSQLVADLVEWTQRWFPGAEAVHRWSAQDYQPHNSTPFVGPLPRGRGRIWLGTGYSKWGMTGAAMAALHLTGDLLDQPPEWAQVLRRRVSRPNTAVTAARSNGKIAAAAAGGWIGAFGRTDPTAHRTPAEGEGVVSTERGRPVAIASNGGTTCRVSAVCTHLGGIVAYNDLEQTWDCPLHGSRFDIEGQVLEGPATDPLPTRSDERHSGADPTP